MHGRAEQVQGARGLPQVGMMILYARIVEQHADDNLGTIPVRRSRRFRPSSLEETMKRRIICGSCIMEGGWRPISTSLGMLGPFK